MASLTTVGLPTSLRTDVERFAAALERHPWGAPISGRLVVAANLGSLQPTMVAALRRWMAPADFDAWQGEQVGRPVATGGKAFIAADGVPTAVVAPLPGRAMFMGMAGHELVELAHLARIAHDAPPVQADELNGTVLADEYVADRVRIEISRELDLPDSPVDAALNIGAQIDDVCRVMGQPAGARGAAQQVFWMHWANLARAWAMAAGRADAGQASAAHEMRSFGAHRVIEDSGWAPVRATLRELYGQPDLSRAAFIARAAAAVWRPIEEYGRTACSRSC